MARIRTLSLAVAISSGLATSGCVSELAQMPIELAAETLKIGVQVGSLGLIQPGRSSPSTAHVVLPQSGGYSQRGAFDDCARLYGSIPGAQAAAMAAQCSGNASRIGSLR